MTVLFQIALVVAPSIFAIATAYLMTEDMTFSPEEREEIRQSNKIQDTY